MPSFTENTPRLHLEGPRLTVKFIISKELEELYRKENKKIPQSEEVRALIDTGATMCCIDQEIPKKLGLQPVGTRKIHTASTQDHICYEYLLRMVIPINQHTSVVQEQKFLAVPLSIQGIDCLIGTDFLKDCSLIYMGYLNQFTLIIP